MEVVGELGSNRQIRFRLNSFLPFRSLYYVSFRAFEPMHVSVCTKRQEFLRAIHREFLATNTAIGIRPPRA